MARDMSHHYEEEDKSWMPKAWRWAVYRVVIDRRNSVLVNFDVIGDTPEGALSNLKVEPGLYFVVPIGKQNAAVANPDTCPGRGNFFKVTDRETIRGNEKMAKNIEPMVIEI